MNTAHITDVGQKHFMPVSSLDGAESQDHSVKPNYNFIVKILFFKSFNCLWNTLLLVVLQLLSNWVDVSKIILDV